MESKDNNYLYNYKELNADHDLKWYDYGARFYDAVIGRWHVVDPMGEKAPSWTSYRYAYNNPTRITDPFGLIEEDVDLAKRYAKRNNQGSIFQHIEEGINFSRFKDNNKEYLVDKELRAMGIDPNKKADFSMKSILTVMQLPSIQKLLNIGKTKLEKILLDANEEIDIKSFYKNGVITMNIKDFSSWRTLAASFGHENVHRIVMGNYGKELFAAGYGFIDKNSWRFPYYYNELLAHTWSYNYSGIPSVNANGQNVIEIMKFNSRNYNVNNVNVVTKFYEKHKILP